MQSYDEDIKVILTKIISIIIMVTFLSKCAQSTIQIHIFDQVLFLNVECFILYAVD